MSTPNRTLVTYCDHTVTLRDPWDNAYIYFVITYTSCSPV